MHSVYRCSAPPLAASSQLPEALIRCHCFCHKRKIGANLTRSTENRGGGDTHGQKDGLTRQRMKSSSSLCCARRIPQRRKWTRMSIDPDSVTKSPYAYDFQHDLRQTSSRILSAIAANRLWLMQRDEQPIRLCPVGQADDKVPHAVQLQANLAVTNLGDQV